MATRTVIMQEINKWYKYSIGIQYCSHVGNGDCKFDGLSAKAMW